MMGLAAALRAIVWQKDWIARSRLKRLDKKTLAHLDELEALLEEDRKKLLRIQRKRNKEA